MPPEKKALGRGLAALLPSRAPAPAPPPASEPHTAVPAEPAQGYPQIAIDLIEPNPVQPRHVFQPERLSELAQSIVEHGIIQPLVVTRKEGGRFQLVTGERRWRAARLAGLDRVPVVVQEFADDRVLEVALIENIQREDLNPMEVAAAFERLARELKLSHEEIGRRTGKERTTVSNMIRLLRLPAIVQRLVAEQRLSMGHARAILGLPTEELQAEVAEKASAQSLSVRQVEQLIHRMTEKREPRTAAEIEQDPNVKAAARELEGALGTRVRIVERNQQRGRIEIEYYSQEDLDRIYNIIVGNAE
jgi:ParB family chromosome partitioning protein